jgi:amino acid transporter
MKLNKAEIVGIIATMLLIIASALFEASMTADITGYAVAFSLICGAIGVLIAIGYFGNKGE